MENDIPKWHLATEADTQAYTERTYNLLQNIAIPKYALSCKDAHCVAHRDDIDCFYISILSVLRIASIKYIPN